MHETLNLQQAGPKSGRRQIIREISILLAMRDSSDITVLKYALRGIGVLAWGKFIAFDQRIF